MSTTAPRSHALPGDDDVYKPGRELKVSSYDNVASLLVSLLILVGFTTALLLLIWLTTRVWFIARPRPVLIEEYAGRGDAPPGFERDLVEPGAEEVEELTEPQLQETLEAVTDVASTVAATLEALEGNSQVTGKGRGGKGDNRQAGPGGDGDNLIPRWERWKITYPQAGLRQYAQILDFFKIELGVVGGGVNHIDYAYNLAKNKPDSRTGPSDPEKRIYLTHQSGATQEADHELLQLAGVRLTGPGGRRYTMQFLSAELENDLAHLELDKAQPQYGVKDIRETVFGVRPRGNGWEFHVISQKYRN